VVVGGPLAEPIDDKFLAGSAELAAYQATQVQYRFVRVECQITFNTQGSETPFERATVQFGLTSDPPGDRRAPVALSMNPSWVTSSRPATTTWKLSPQLTFAGVEGSLGEVAGTAGGGESDPSLRAGNQLSAIPKWDLFRTREHELERPQPPLQLVLRLPAHAKARLEVGIQAWVKKSGLARFSNRELAPGYLAIDLP
jgi:hypothetical protein